MASSSPSQTTSCQHPDGICKPIPVKKSLHPQGQISWYSSVQSSSIFRFRLAHKPLYILRFKKIEQGQLSYPKICPLYFDIAWLKLSLQTHIIKHAYLLINKDL